MNFKAETVCVYKVNKPQLGICTWVRHLASRLSTAAMKLTRIVQTYTEVDDDSPAPITQEFKLVTKSVVWQY